MRVITLNDDEALINYAQPIVAELRANMVRVDADYSATPFKAKIADPCAGGCINPHARPTWTLIDSASRMPSRCWIPPAMSSPWSRARSFPD